MRASLIGDDIGNNSALDQFRQNIGTIAHKSHRKRLSILSSLVDPLERVIKRARDLIAISTLQSFLDSRGIHFHAEKDRAVHGCGKRLRATHPPEPSG